MSLGLAPAAPASSRLRFSGRLVSSAASAFAFARFVGEAGKVRIGKARVAMDGDREDVGAGVEDVLSSVAVVNIPVDDQHPLGSQALRVAGSCARATAHTRDSSVSRVNTRPGCWARNFSSSYSM